MLAHYLVAGGMVWTFTGTRGYCFLTRLLSHRRRQSEDEADGELYLLVYMYLSHVQRQYVSSPESLVPVLNC